MVVAWRYAARAQKVLEREDAVSELEVELAGREELVAERRESFRAQEQAVATELEAPSRPKGLGFRV